MCYGLNVWPSKICILKPFPQDDGVRGEAFGKWVLEGKDFLNGRVRASVSVAYSSLPQEGTLTREIEQCWQHSECLLGDRWVLVIFERLSPFISGLVSDNIFPESKSVFWWNGMCIAVPVSWDNSEGKCETPNRFLYIIWL